MADSADYYTWSFNLRFNPAPPEQIDDFERYNNTTSVWTKIYQFFNHVIFRINRYKRTWTQMPSIFILRIFPNVNDTFGHTKFYSLLTDKRRPPEKPPANYKKGQNTNRRLVRSPNDSLPMRAQE